MSKMRYNIYTVVFAAILGLACATLLTVAAEFTRQRQNENQEGDGSQV